MKITVDTKEDSAEEIQKAIELLTKLMQAKGASTESGAVTGGLFNMFDDNQDNEQNDSEDKPSEDSESPSIFNLFQDDKPKDSTEAPEEPQSNPEKPRSHAKVYF